MRNNDLEINSAQENTPLLKQNRSSKYAAKLLAAGCCIATIGSSIAAIIYFSTKNKKNKANTELTYSFASPYEGSGSIVIHNDNDFSVEITEIQFVTNVVIDTKAEGIVYGDLAPWEAKIEQVAKTDSQHTYLLKEPDSQAVILEPNSSQNFTYIYEKALGIINTEVLPTNIQLTTKQGRFDLGINNQCEGDQCNDPFRGKIVGGYYTDWDMYARQYPATRIPVNKLNNIYYAFINYNRNGDISLLDSYSDNLQLPALMQLQQQNSYLKVHLCFGGYTLSSEFPYLAQNPSARLNFSQNVLAMLQQFKFAGVQLDWEYPQASDSNNYVLLVKTLREVLDASGKKYVISLAVPAGQSQIDAIGYNWQEIARYVDYNCLMGYDYSGPWSAQSGYQSPLYTPPNNPEGRLLSVNGTLPLYKQYNFPMEKTVLGLPAYFRGVKVSNMNNYGMYQPVTGAPVGQYDNSGIFDYTCALFGNCYGGNGLPPDCVYLNEKIAPYGNYTHTPLITCPNELMILTGDATTSVIDKSCYALKNNLQGVFFWSLSGDERNNEQASLLTAASNVYKKNSICNYESKQVETKQIELPTKPISNDNEWLEFIGNVQSNIMVQSYLSGLTFALLFKMVDQLTEKMLQSILPNKIFVHQANSSNSDKNLAYVHYSVKTLIYFTTLYTLGLPFLPSIVSSGIAYSLKQLQFSNLSSELSGVLASLYYNVGTKVDISNSADILNAITVSLASLAGSFTPMAVNQLGKLKNYTASVWNNFSREKVVSYFFSTKPEPKTNDNVDRILQPIMHI